MASFKQAVAALAMGGLIGTASAQFTGPSATGRAMTVAEVSALGVGRYVTVTGRLVEHLREDYYTFRDSTGDIRVEIDDEVWRHRRIGPDATVRLVAEVDRGATGVYLWVKSLERVD